MKFILFVEGKSALNHGNFSSARQGQGCHSDFSPFAHVVGIGAGFFPPASAWSASAQDFFLPEIRGRHRRRIFSSQKCVVGVGAGFFPPKNPLSGADGPFFGLKNPLSALTDHFLAQKIPCRRGQTIFFEKKSKVCANA